MPRKTSAQLAREIKAALTRPLLPRDWPDFARRVVLDAARWYDKEVHGEWAVPDVLLDEAVTDVGQHLERLERERGLDFDDASETWINRYESGKLDDEMKAAISAWSSARDRSARM